MEKNIGRKEITKEMIDAISFDKLIKDPESLFRDEKFLEKFFKKDQVFSQVDLENNEGNL